MYEKFEQLLKERGITAYRVSKETGITTATFTSWKQGKYTPKQDKLQLIADFFGKPLEYFTGISKEKEERPLPEWATAKDKRDFKKIMMDADADITFDGIPMSEEAKQRVLGYVESMYWEEKKNRRKKEE